MSASSSSLLVEQADGVLTLTLNRPDVLNSFNREMAFALQDALRQAADDPSVRAVVLTGAGRGFCAGQDLAEALPQDGGPMPDIGEIVRPAKSGHPGDPFAGEAGVVRGEWHRRRCGSESGVRVRHHDRGGRSELRGEPKLGLIPDTSGTFFVPRLVGVQRATGMFFLAEKMGAAQAKSWGLIWDVAPRADLMETVQKLAKQLATQATRGFGLTKRAMNASFGHDLDAQLEVEAQAMHEAGRTADYEEGVRAFLEKRAPGYRGA